MDKEINFDTNINYLNIIRLNIYFNEPNTFDVEAHDLYELISILNCDCKNIITIKKNSFFLILLTRNEAFRLYRKLNNYYIEKLNARIEIQMCIEDEKSSFKELQERFKAIFEIEIPELDHFDIKRRIFGVNSYNVERLKNLCEKEYFEGELNIEYLGIEEETRAEFGKEYGIRIFRLLVEGDKKEKFHYCCKLIHELSANIFEAFKKLDKRYNAKVSHRFRIIKQDYNLAKMELIN